MIQDILKERGTNYGEFITQAALSQSLKATLRLHSNWKALPSDVQEAFDMILHKMARVVNGDVTYKDSYVDIIGYTQLVINRLERDAEVQAILKKAADRTAEVEEVR